MKAPLTEDQRDWLMDNAVPMLASLQEAVWPGKEQWKPTEEIPQQDFFEAAVESMRTIQSRYNEASALFAGWSESDFKEPS